ncbi:hypothetical protein EDF62_3318 [Leucobacter luti]|uniref:Uncharacterized protein n=1 Tax=Leucobacter luti TaxID=340320 RepID=A0A4R6RTG8_9MICO|nr:hypothetical protein [Leucobacter luti]TDP89565.1 hypothetical protein EDF62_3318 [Leucobacter luti]
MSQKIEVRKLAGSKQQKLVLGTTNPLIAQQYADMLGCSDATPGRWMRVDGKYMPSGDEGIPAVLLTP